jgi:hypothetical protein
MAAIVGSGDQSSPCFQFVFSVPRKTKGKLLEEAGCRYHIEPPSLLFRCNRRDKDSSQNVKCKSFWHMIVCMYVALVNLGGCMQLVVCCTVCRIPQPFNTSTEWATQEFWSGIFVERFHNNTRPTLIFLKCKDKCFGTPATMWNHSQSRYIYSRSAGRVTK